MRGGALLSLGLLAALILSGCAGKSNSSSTSESSGDGTGSSGGPSPQSGGAATSTTANSLTAGNRAPTITALRTNITAANVTTGAAPLKVTFTFNATDADKDNLTFRLVFGDKTTNATGKMPTKGVNHTYAAAGSYNATLFVSDGKLTVNKTLLIAVGGPAIVGTRTASITDPTGDSTDDLTDLTKLTLTLDGTMLVAVVNSVTVWSQPNVVSPVSYSLTVNGGQFTCFSRYAIDSNPMLWDNTAGAYMAAGSCAWDQTAKTTTFNLPLETLKANGAKAPFSVYASGNIGNVLTGNAPNGQSEDDVAPDAGTLSIG